MEESFLYVMLTYLDKFGPLYQPNELCDQASHIRMSNYLLNQGRTYDINVSKLSIWNTYDFTNAYEFNDFLFKTLRWSLNCVYLGNKGLSPNLIFPKTLQGPIQPNPVLDF